MSEPDAPSTVVGILFAHGSMAEGMVDALRTISGVDENAVVPVSNVGRGPEELAAVVDQVAGSRPAIVFADLQSGSCAAAARVSCRGQGRRVVVCGVNLPMLLDFVFHREMSLDDLADRLVGKAREAVRTFPHDGEEGHA